MKDEFEGAVRAIFEVRETLDDRGRLGKALGYFFNENDAHDEAAGNGWYGSDAAVRARHCIKVKGVNYLLESDQPIEFGSTQSLVRKRALAKLTEEEREALGLA